MSKKNSAAVVVNKASKNKADNAKAKAARAAAKAKYDAENPPKIGVKADGWADIHSEAGIAASRKRYVIPQRVRVTILGHSATAVFKAMALRKNGKAFKYSADEIAALGQSGNKKVVSTPVEKMSTITTAISDARSEGPNRAKYTNYAAIAEVSKALDWAAIDAELKRLAK